MSNPYLRYFLPSNAQMQSAMLEHLLRPPTCTFSPASQYHRQSFALVDLGVKVFWRDERRTIKLESTLERGAGGGMRCRQGHMVGL
jgi:hypothetical protein